MKEVETDINGLDYMTYKGCKLKHGDGISFNQTIRFTTVIKSLSPALRAGSHDAGVCVLEDANRIIHGGVFQNYEQKILDAQKSKN